MADQGTRENPYAPPREPVELTPGALPVVDGDAEITAALAELDVAIKDGAVGAHEPRRGWQPTVLLVIGAVAALLAVVQALATSQQILLSGGIVLFVLASVGLTAVLGFYDERVSSRRRDHGDELRCWRDLLHALRCRDTAFVHACLAPRARRQPARVPDLAPCATVPGVVDDLSEPDRLRGYLERFLLPDRSKSRSLQIRRLQVELLNDRVAVATAELRLSTVGMAPVVAAVLSGLTLILLPLSLLLIVVVWWRGRRVYVSLRRTLLRGSDGLWYLHEGDWGRPGLTTVTPG